MFTVFWGTAVRVCRGGGDLNAKVKRIRVIVLNEPDTASHVG